MCLWKLLGNAKIMMLLFVEVGRTGLIKSFLQNWFCEGQKGFRVVDVQTNASKQNMMENILKPLIQEVGITKKFPLRRKQDLIGESG